MCICDWGSDLCSSQLMLFGDDRRPPPPQPRGKLAAVPLGEVGTDQDVIGALAERHMHEAFRPLGGNDVHEWSPSLLQPAIAARTAFAMASLRTLPDCTVRSASA